MKLPHRQSASQGTEVDYEMATRLLHLEEFEVIHVADDKNRRLRYVDIIPKVAVGVCPQCACACNSIHQKREREVVDLPLDEFQTKLRIRFYQFFCERCHHYFLQRFKAIASDAHATERFLERTAEMIKHSDIKNMCVSNYKFDFKIANYE